MRIWQDFSSTAEKYATIEVKKRTTLEHILYSFRETECPIYQQLNFDFG